MPCHPELDSGSIHLSVIDINRFRVKHGMTKLGDNRFFTSLGERSQLCESNELQMRVRVNPVGETSCHPEPDSGSIHSVENVINRFRVKHGMTPNVDIFPLHGGVLGWGTARSDSMGGKTLHFQACSFDYKSERRV